MPNPKITLVGRIGQDPEPIGSGLRLRVATNDRVKNQNGDWEDGKTSWWTVKVWKKQAEYAKAVLKKGQEITVVGTISEETWTDKNTQALRSTYDVNADSIAVTAYSLQNSKSNRPTREDVWDISEIEPAF